MSRTAIKDLESPVGLAEQRKIVGGNPLAALAAAPAAPYVAAGAAVGVVYLGVKAIDASASAAAYDLAIRKHTYAPGVPLPANPNDYLNHGFIGWLLD